MDRHLNDRLYATIYDLVIAHVEITAAADVAANGYTVGEGSSFVASAARTAEGVMLVTLKDTSPKILNALCTCTKKDTVCTPTAVSGTAGTVEITFDTAGSDADPDSATIHLTILIRNSGEVM